MTLFPTSAAVSTRNKFSSGFKFLAILLLVILVSGKSWGQTIIDNSATGTSIPSSWSSTNSIVTQAIQQSGYYLLESNSPSFDYLTTGTYSTIIGASSVTVDCDIATYGSGTSTTIKVEMSLDGGSSWAYNQTSSTVSSTTYVTKTLTFTNQISSSNVQFRFSDGTNATPFTRVKNIIIKAYFPPTKLAISSISPTSPTLGSSFSVTVQAQDGSGNPSNVVLGTGISLSNTGGGTIGGTTTGTITAGTNQVTITGVTLSASGTGITLTAARTSGDALTIGNSSSFTVVPADPTSVSATTASNSQINLAATATGGNNVVVIYNSSGTFTGPTAGSAPGSVGTSLTGSGGTIVYAGTASGLSSHSSLASNTLFYYKTFSYDSNNLYSTGVTANATTQAIATTGTIGSLTSATATTAQAPTSGNSITAGGAATLTARGLAWGTSASPTTLVSSGTTTGTYAQTLSNLNAQTQYYTRAYATNAGGTSYGSDAGFMTLSAIPTAQPTSISGTGTGSGSFSVTLTGNATYPASGATKAGYLLLYSTSTPALIASPNGLAPASVISTGTQIAVTETTLPTTPTVTGLSASGLSVNTTYNLLIVPYTWDGTNAATYNYFTIGAKTGTATTLLTQYYSKSIGNLDQLSSWTDDITLAAGNAPADFTSANQAFNIRNNATPTIGADWTVSGTNSKIIVGDGTNGCNFTIPSAYKVAGTVDVAAGATLSIANTNNYPILGTLAATSTVAYTGTSAQTVAAAIYGNLSISTTGGSATAGGTIVANTSLNIDNGSVFDLGTNALTGTTLTTNGTGTLKTQNTTATPIPSTKTWTMDVLYNSTSPQTVVAGNYKNLDLTGAARTLINGGTIGISGIYTPGTGTLTVTGNTIDFNGTGTQIIPAANYNNITVSGARTSNNVTLANSGSINIAGTSSSALSITASFSTGYGFVVTNSTLNFTGSNPSIPKPTAVTGGGNFYNLIVGVSGTATIAATPTIETGGTLTVNSGSTLDLGTTQMSFGTGCTVTISGQLNVARSAGLLGTTSTAFDNTNTPTIALGSLSIINYTATTAAQTVSAANYANLTISGGRSGSGATLTLGNGIIGVSGTLSYTASGSGITTINTTGNTFDFTSTGSQTIPAFTYNNLSNSGGGARILANGTINIAGTYIPSAGTTTSGGTSCIVNFNGTNGQTIPAGTYYSISSTNNTRTLANGTIQIGGSLTPGTSNYTIGTSTVEFNGNVAQTIPVLPVASGSNYFNLTYSGTNTGTLAGSITAGGNVTISGTGTMGITNAGSRTLTINGNLVLTSGKLDWAVSGSTTSGIINLLGNITETSGITYTTATSIPNGTINFTGNGTVGSPQQISLSSNNTFQYTNLTINSGTVVQVNNSFILTGSATANYVGTLTVNGTLNLLSNSITSSAASSAFILNSGGTLITSSSTGIAGAIPSTNMTRTFNSGANYEFQGAVTGTFTTTPNANTVNNLTLNRSGAITVTSATAITGLLYITSGTTVTLNTGTNTAGSIKIGSSNGVNGTWGSSSSAATYKNAAFASTGIVTVSTNTAASASLSITNSPVTYNGLSQSATFSSSGTVSSILYGGSATVPTNAATYAVTANVASSSDGFTSGGTTVSAGNFVINQANSTVTVNGTTGFTYNGSAQGPAFNKTGSTNSLTYIYASTDGGGYSSTTSAPTAAGSYTVTASVAADANYYGASSSATAFTIAQANSTVTVNGTTSFTYNGSAQGPAFNKTGSTNSLTYIYASTDGGGYSSTTSAPTAAGSYTVTASVAADVNYNGASSSATTFTIAQAPLTITGITANSKSYDGTNSATLAGTAAYSGLVNNESYSVTDTPSATFANANVGNTKTVTVTGYTTPTTNYSITQPSGLTANITALTLTISSSQSIGTDALLPGTDLTVLHDALLTVDNDSPTTVHSITVNQGGKLTLVNYKSLTILGNLTLQSGSTYGTGTLVDENATSHLTVLGTTSVEQDLSAVRNWYISSPIASAQSNSLPTGTLWKYNELNTGVTSGGAQWDVITSNESLGVMQGYIFKPGSTGKVTFTGSALNTGNQSVVLNRTENGQLKRGFNLVGNPYPSYLDWMAAINTSNTDTKNLMTTLWYRTQNPGNPSATPAVAPYYVFDTYNENGGAGTNNNGNGAVTGMIPPMQAFWVRVNAAGDGKTTTGTLAVTNAMRSHESGTNRMKAPALSSQPMLRLQVSNGASSDEAIVLFNPNASDGFDDFDSPKMTNGNAAIPEIYTIAGTEQLVINGLKTLPSTLELPLGFTTGQSNTFTIKASEISNFTADTRIFLVDKLLNTDQELTADAAYTFTSDKVSTTDRFALIFKTPSITDGLNAVDEGSFWISGNSANEIIVHGLSDAKTTVEVYNELGQKLISNTLMAADKALRTPRLVPGVYMLTLSTAGKTITRKVILK